MGVRKKRSGQEMWGGEERYDGGAGRRSIRMEKEGGKKRGEKRR